MRSTMRTAAAVGCAVALVTLLAASVAAAGYKTGHYAGETSQGESIGFRAKKLSVKKFDFALRVDCDDGSAFDLLEPSGAQAPTDDRGKFKAIFTTQISGGVESTTVLKGRLKRQKASGSLHAEGITSAGASCSGAADWSAERQ